MIGADDPRPAISQRGRQRPEVAVGVLGVEQVDGLGPADQPARCAGLDRERPDVVPLARQHAVGPLPGPPGHMPRHLRLETIDGHPIREVPDHLVVSGARRVMGEVRVGEADSHGTPSGSSSRRSAPGAAMARS